MRIALLLFCVMVFPVCAQTMYKWVDEKGVTHFSQDPPPDGNKGAQKIEVKTTQPERPPTDNWRQREQESKQQKAKQGMDEERARQQDEAQRGQRCRTAQRRADAMKNYSRVFRLDEKGERVYYDDKQRESELAEAQSEIARYCN